MEHPLITNARRVDEHEATWGSTVKTEEISRKILEIYPDLFTDVNYLMTAPVDLVFGKPVSARTHAISAQYSSKLAGWRGSSDMGDMAKRVEEEIVNILAQGIGRELQDLSEKLKSENKVMCPYVLITASPHRQNGEDVFDFITRYGVFDN